MSSTPADYGSVEQQPVNTEDQSYDIDNTYYVKERPLSCKERTRKLVLVALPILAAVMIMGGFAFFLFHDFGTLYPHHSGGGSNDPSSVSQTPRNYFSGDRTSAPKGSNESVPVTEPKGSDTKTTSSCSANIKCQKLGLTGECCPTAQGVKLGCCG